MKRFTSLLNRTKSHDNTTTNNYDLANAPADSPEANATRAIRLFCESGSTSNGGEEVLHLPVIVEAAESSPAAAAAAAHQIRKFLSREWSSKAYVQYNSIMLIRILSDNPGATFTRNFDKGFVSTVKDLLRNGKDKNTQTILRETLDALEVNKGYDEGLQGLLQMWRKEKGHMASLSTSGSRMVAPQGRQGANGQRMSYQQGGPQFAQPGAQYQDGYSNGMHAQQPVARTGGRNQLPSPSELASRIEEARNTAKILMQLIQSTPPEELMQNDLVKEFSERCQSAQKSMQTYINCESPPPDDDTMQTLIEATEQLSLAGSRYQRAVLAARRAMGASPSPHSEGTQNGNETYSNGTSAFAVAPLSPQQSLTPPQPYANSPYPQQPQQQMPTNGYESYQSPSSPPPNRMSNLLQQRQLDPRYSQAYPPSQPYPHHHQQQQTAIPMPDGPSDPFADPVEHDPNPPPLAIEPTNYGNAANARNQYLHNRHPSQAFSIDAPDEPVRPHPTDRTETYALENAYRTSSYAPAPAPSASPSISAPSPILSRRDVREGSDASTISGLSPQYSPEKSRPAAGPWHNGAGATPSYIGRQNSALNGLTMHGAQSEDDVAEIDSHSELGRNDPSSAASTRSSGDALSNSARSSARSSLAPSPVEVRTAQQARRVDVAGTGGFRNSFVGRR